MTLALHVDVARWRAHLRDVVAETPHLVPVAKGNGYGLGIPRLAAEAERLAVDCVAVGTAAEVPPAALGFRGDVLVLAPWRPDLGEPVIDGPVLRTVSHPAALRAAAGTGVRVVVEVMTSMHRHGLPPEALAASVLPDGVECAGAALHLPLAGEPYAEARALASLARERLGVDTVWVSHLDAARARALQADARVAVRSRVGTALWLGDRGALRPRARVLDAHRLARGTAYGYRQRRMRRDGWLLVVAGGTAHGIGLEAPKAARGVAARARVLAAGGLAAGGLVRSPFRVSGRRPWFAEPPHMQVSLLLLPASATPPEVGGEVDVDVRMTTTAFDAIVDG